MDEIFVGKAALKERTEASVVKTRPKEEIYTDRTVPYAEQKKMGLPKNRYC